MKKTFLIALVLTATLTVAQAVQYNYDRDANFSTYKTYQWVEEKSPAGQPLLDQDIRRAIDGQLASKGLTKVEHGGDLTIAYRTAIDRERQIDAWTMGPRWSVMAHANTSTIDVGTVLLSIYETGQKRLVWRGSVTKTLNVKKDPDKNYKNLEKAVRTLLVNYPPKSER
jgi:hypothetical protein